MASQRLESNVKIKKSICAQQKAHVETWWFLVFDCLCLWFICNVLLVYLFSKSCPPTQNIWSCVNESYKQNWKFKLWYKWTHISIKRYQKWTFPKYFYRKRHYYDKFQKFTCWQRLKFFYWFIYLFIDTAIRSSANLIKCSACFLLIGAYIFLHNNMRKLISQTRW